MKTEHSSRYLNRSHILRLLSDEEMARISKSEADAGLVIGEEYIDLSELEDGVLRADGSPLSTRRLLPKKAISDASWTKILAQLQSMAM